MKKFEKFIIPGGGNYFLEITVPNVCSCYTYSSYLIMCWDIFQRHGLDNRYMGI